MGWKAAQSNVKYPKSQMTKSSGESIWRWGNLETLYTKAADYSLQYYSKQQ